MEWKNNYSKKSQYHALAQINMIKIRTTLQECKLHYLILILFRVKLREQSMKDLIRHTLNLKLIQKHLKHLAQSNSSIEKSLLINEFVHSMITFIYKSCFQVKIPWFIQVKLLEIQDLNILRII